jgi:hypothetical protein
VVDNRVRKRKPMDPTRQTNPLKIQLFTHIETRNSKYTRSLNIGDKYKVTGHKSRYGRVMLSVLATGSKVRGFKPGRCNGFLEAKSSAGLLFEGK